MHFLKKHRGVYADQCQAPLLLKAETCGKGKLLNLNEDSQESRLLNSVQAISRITAFSDTQDISRNSSELELLEKQKSSSEQLLRVMKQESFSRSMLSESNARVSSKNNQMDRFIPCRMKENLQAKFEAASKN